jgi:DnaK suppressor protein
MREPSTRVVQVTNLRPTLLAERARILSGRQNDLEVLSAPRGLAEDDQAALLHEQFVALRRSRIDHNKLRLIDAALARLDREEFGVCNECGEDIASKRLNVLPWAENCIRCQEKLDANQYEAEPAALTTA